MVMNTESNKNSIRDKVLQVIEEKKIIMQPKWHFVLRTVLMLVGVLLVSLVLLYLASFIFFVLRHTGVWFVPGFGFGGLNALVTSLPWLLIVVTGVFVVLLEILVKKYAFAYGKPLLYSAIGILFLVTVGGFLVALTPLHRGLFMEARDQHLPLAGDFYRAYGQPRFRNITAGTIVEVVSNGYNIRDHRNERVMVIVTPETQFPFGSDLKVEDSIVILGSRDDNMIQALGIRKIFDEVPHPDFHEDQPFINQ